jgi:hypothetical protein
LILAVSGQVIGNTKIRFTRKKEEALRPPETVVSNAPP